MNKDWADRITEIENEFEKIVVDSLKLQLESLGTKTGSAYDTPSTFTARIPIKNDLLKNTNLIYNESNKVIHFTSMQVLYSIINEGAIRLYNLNNSSDKEEYIYASNYLKKIYELQGYSIHEIDCFFKSNKTDSFILSCTYKENLNNADFWDEYGDNGKGIAIELEILNDIYTWNNFYISKVYYDQLHNFNQLKKNWLKLLENYPLHKFIIQLDQILALHKSKKWKKEEEIRILAFLREININKIVSHLYKDFKTTNPNKDIQYFRLPLCDKNKKLLDSSLEQNKYVFWGKIPKLRISNIYFGPNFPNSIDFTHFTKSLQKYISDKMNCWLPNLYRNQIIKLN